MSDVRATAAGEDSIALSFGAAGTDGVNPPPATSYVVKQSERPIRTLRDFRSAPALCDGDCAFGVSAVGATIVLQIGELRPRHTYYYEVAARDNVSGRCGPRSKTVKATTRKVKPLNLPGHEGGGEAPAVPKDRPTPTC